ncbi:MAG: GGDEF domain-containing protein [Sphaerospermopsis kisseleviana]
MCEGPGVWLTPRLLRQAQYKSLSRSQEITVYLGVTGFPQHGAIGTALIQTADAALYRAKAAGRNQVVVAP